MGGFGGGWVRLWVGFDGWVGSGWVCGMLLLGIVFFVCFFIYLKDREFFNLFYWVMS